MDSVDILRYSMSIGFIVLTGFIAYVAYEAAQVLRSTKSLIDKVNDMVENIEDVAAGIRAVKNNFKMGYLNAVSGILSYLFARRDKKRGGEE